MTPFEIEIMLHYYTRANDFRDGDFSAPALLDALHRFRDVGLLALVMSDGVAQHPTYAITERGRAYVEALQEVQWPVQRWVMPS